MVRTDVSDYLEFIHMPSGRDAFALASMRALVVDKLGSDSPLLSVFDDAIAQGRETLRVEFAWEEAKRAAEDKSRGRALPLKQSIVRQLSSIDSIVTGRTVGDEDDKVCIAARRFLREVFPNGVAGISNQKFEIMLGILRTMIDEHLKKTLAEDIKTLGIQREVQRLTVLTDRFAKELLATKRARVTHDDVEVARHDLHEAMAEVLVEILHATSKRNFTPASSDAPVSDEVRIKTREELLAPFNAQQQIVADAYSRHRVPLDVDPDTGEEIDPDGEETETTGA